MAQPATPSVGWAVACAIALIITWFVGVMASTLGPRTPLAPCGRPSCFLGFSTVQNCGKPQSAHLRCPLILPPCGIASWCERAQP
jgi:hypothetical protein